MKYRKYMPMRFVFNILLIFIEVAIVVTLVVLVTIQSRYSLIAEAITQIAVAIVIITGNDNPDYKVPWLFFVLVLPVIGFMLYFMFYSRKLNPVQRRKLRKLYIESGVLSDSADASRLREENSEAFSQAVMLKRLANTHIYTDTEVTYFPLGDEMFPAMIEDLKQAKRFIFLEYFIIQNGWLWQSVLEVLQQKVRQGVEVRVIYDDIGCMRTLPGHYFSKLKKMGIKCVTFSRLRAQANNKFNNRNHRKITVIDGRVGYTGGANIADEYVNMRKRFGHWKDVGIRIEGGAVNELTRLFLADYGMNVGTDDDFLLYYNGETHLQSNGFVVPFGDGPKPMYTKNIAKMAIINLLSQANHHVYMTSPYLIIDNELTQAIENAALRGVDVRIITPHIPDKKLIFTMTRSYYKRLMDAGVKIYEYVPGFIHAKMYIADGNTAIIGTVNLDYRSLVHHFENAVWLHDMPAIADMEADFLHTQSDSIEANGEMLRQSLPGRFVRTIVKIFAPLL